MSMPPDCCLKGFAWEGTPTGKETKLNTNATYVSGTNPSVAIVVIHDLFGWKWNNLRLLADHFAAEADATVYVPDFFGGEALDPEKILAARWEELDLPDFVWRRNNKEVRGPEMVEFVGALRRQGFERVGAVGYCYGGWAVFRLAGAEWEEGRRLVDFVSAGHPSGLTAKEIVGVRIDVPVQLLAPEHDGQFTPELKLHAFVALQKKGVSFEYQHFPGVEHACLTRGDEKVPGDRAALVRGKNAVVAWARQWLHEV
ncbi:Dienelactone hydrolase family protein [Coniochaeta hoffmannii]|uniref:Dienelactone hydrolase family protein n=1 Tax=Coniochaeta hoffmannii TaxID=91930 RepID=A0AA38RA98_9PEZI|nr:Dienelactone hydrolase family protein [Coniochaeta hoffmannii]